MLPDPQVRELVAPRLLEFWQFFHTRAGTAKAVLSVRDLLAWAHFVNVAAPSIGALPAYAHGAHLVLLDGIGLGEGMPLEVSCSPTRAAHNPIFAALVQLQQRQR